MANIDRKHRRIDCVWQIVGSSELSGRTARPACSTEARLWMRRRRKNNHKNQKPDRLRHTRGHKGGELIQINEGDEILKKRFH